MAKKDRIGVHGSDEETGRAKANGEAAKCPVTREEFLAGAKSLEVEIGGAKRFADVKEFSTGSFGYFLNDRLPVMVSGKQLKVMVNLVVTVIGSKDAAKA